MLDGHGRVCPEDERSQKEWGCYEDAIHAPYSIDCRCQGANKNCSYCNGEGEKQYYRCPVHVLANARKTNYLLNCYYDLEGNIHLVEGGYNKQPYLWINAHRLIRSTINEIDSERADRAKRAAKKK